MIRRMLVMKVELSDKEVNVLKSGLKALTRSLSTTKGRTSSVLIEAAIEKELADVALCTAHMHDLKDIK